MKKNILFVILIIPSFLLAQDLSIPFQQQTDSLFLLHPDATGVLVHVESPENNMSWSYAIGHSNVETEEKLKEQHPVLIASNTKPYVAAAILRLVELEEINLNSPIEKLLKPKLREHLKNDGYNLNEITIKHLLSHTSGIADYVDSAYFHFVDQNPTYQWKKEEQIQRTIDIGEPLFTPGTDYSYGDINYLLLTDIIEEKTKKPFYQSIKSLLKFDELNLNQTWFKDLDPYPVDALPLAHQYSEEHNWDSGDINPSWDLYGGGGIATTVKEAALFMQYLFEGKIINDPILLQEMTSYVLPKEKSAYCLGITHFTFPTFSAYYHGGWWGTDVAYCPETNSSVAIFTLQKAKRQEFAKLSVGMMKSLAAQKAIETDTIVTDNYELFKKKNSTATLVLFPGGGSNAKGIQEEFNIVDAALKKGVNVLMMNFNRHLWLDEEKTSFLSNQLNQIFIDNKLTKDNVYIGGMSIGGNVALTLSDHLHCIESEVKAKGVFIIDSPIDLNALYESAQVDINNPNLDEDRLAEPKAIVNFLQSNFGADNALKNNLQALSPFTLKTKHINVPELKQCKLRFYTEPDKQWWLDNRQTKFEYTNAYTIQQVSKICKENGWADFELIETKNKGYRSDGTRHPHSWSIVDIDDLLNWVKE